MSLIRLLLPFRLNACAMCCVSCDVGFITFAVHKRSTGVARVIVFVYGSVFMCTAVTYRQWRWMRECRGALKISSRRLRVKAELASSLPPVLLIIVPFHPMPWLNPCKTIRASISHMAALTLFPCHRTTLPRLAFILQISSSTVGECMCACTPHILFFLFAPPFFSGT